MLSDRRKIATYVSRATATSRRLGVVLLPPQDSRKVSELAVILRLTIPDCQATNSVIQKSQQSKQLVVHVYKLRLCLGETSVSWVAESDIGAGDDMSRVENGETTSTEGVGDPDGIEETAEVDDVDTTYFPATLDIAEEHATPARRQRRQPRHLADFVARATTNCSTRRTLANEL